MRSKYFKRQGQRQLLKYLTTGGSAFISEYVSFLVLFSVLSLPLIIANSISFLVGFSISFTFNRKWTFNAKTQYRWAAHHQLVAYLLLSVINLLASNVLIFEVHKFLPASISKILAVGMIACWNFFIYRAAIFQAKKISDGKDGRDSVV